MATSSPKLNIVILGAIIIAPIRPTDPTIKSKLTPCHFADVNPPAIQKLNSCERLKYIEVPIANEINKVPMAVPAKANLTGSTFLPALELIKYTNNPLILAPKNANIIFAKLPKTKLGFILCKTKATAIIKVAP